MSKGDDIDAIIAGGGISWGRGGASNKREDDGKVKTKAKKKNTSPEPTEADRPGRKPNIANNGPTVASGKRRA